MPRHVVFVDESIHEIQPIVLELTLQGVTVTPCPTADDCLDLVLEGLRPSLFILDVMLLSRGAFSENDTGGYLYTGLLLGRVIRELLPEAPVIFFTSTASKEGLRYIDLTVKSIGNSKVLLKHSIGSPGDFAGHVLPVVETGLVGPRRRGLFRTLVENLIVQPNVAGVGFDVKAFVQQLARQRASLGSGHRDNDDPA